MRMLTHAYTHTFCIHTAETLPNGNTHSKNLCCKLSTKLTNQIYVYAHVCMCVGVCAHGGQRSILHFPSVLYFETVSHEPGSLLIQLDGSFCLSCAGITSMDNHTDFLMWVLRIELRSSCLQTRTQPAEAPLRPVEIRLLQVQ